MILHIRWVQPQHFRLYERRQQQALHQDLLLETAGGGERREGSSYPEGLEYNPLDSTATPSTVIPCIQVASPTPKGMREAGAVLIVRQLNVCKVRVQQKYATATSFATTQ